jgi:hypothetical protein
VPPYPPQVDYRGIEHGEQADPDDARLRTCGSPLTSAAMTRMTEIGISSRCATATFYDSDQESERWTMILAATRRCKRPTIRPEHTPPRGSKP